MSPPAQNEEDEDAQESVFGGEDHPCASAGEAGQKVKDVIREHGISEQTYYRWKSKYGGMSVSEAKRLKQLEAENRQLKKLVADLSLDKQMLQEVLDRKW